jgi:hypothetical protein
LVVAGLALCLCGCTQRDQQSVENSLWQMFRGHPKPIILKKPDPPLYCYETLGERDCYTQPLGPAGQPSL